MSSEVNEVAKWLVATGYPFDWSCDVLPPVVLRRAIEQAWIDKDSDGADDEDLIRVCVADEGRWMDAL